MPSFACQVNGRAVTVESWDPAQPLLYVLRNELGLHGAKFGCGLGQCGACTVLVDNQPTRSCMLPVSRAVGKAIATPEGFGSSEQPDRLQAAFIAEQAAQCGYCTSGMVTSARALLSRNPTPTIEQVKQGLAGNVCRCGTHTRIVQAVMRASRA